MTKLCVISDTHNKHKHITTPRCDILIHCGDFTTYGSKEETVNFAEWFGKQRANHKIVIPGNHDQYTYLFQRDGKDLFKENGATLLIGEEISLEGISFYGSPWTPSFSTKWSFQYNRRCADTIWDGSLDYDVLITHGPPHGILDYVPKKKRHAGCLGLLNAIAKTSPRYHLFGHIHESPGRVKSDAIPTVFINATSWDHVKQEIRKPVVLEL